MRHDFPIAPLVTPHDGDIEPADRKTFPIQATAKHPAHYAQMPRCVYMAAYEVYSAVFSTQKAMVTGGCRGGFGNGELIAFLYARSFPRQEWAARFEEALKDMDIK